MGEDEDEGFFKVAAVQSGRNPQVTAIIERRLVCAHRVAESALFADFLKKARAGVRSENDVEEMRGVAAFVAMADSRKREGKLGLLDIAGGCDDFRRFAWWRTRFRTGSFSVREALEGEGDFFHNVLVADISCCGDDGAGSVVVGFAVAAKILGGHGFDAR